MIRENFGLRIIKGIFFLLEKCESFISSVQSDLKLITSASWFNIIKRRIHDDKLKIKD